MKKFEDQIKETYSELQIPSYSEAAWEKFQAHAEIKDEKSNRKMILFLFGLLFIAISSILIFKPFNKINETHPLEIVDSNVEKNLTTDVQLNDVDDLEKNEINKDISNPILEQTKTIKQSNLRSNVQSFNSNTEAPRTIVKNDDFASSSIPNKTDGIVLDNDFVTQEIATDNKFIESAKINVTENLVSIPNIHLELIPQIRKLKINAFLEPIRPVKTNQVQKGFSYGIKLGYGYLDHRVIESNSLRNIENSIYFNYGKYLRLKGDVGLDNIRYNTRIFSLNLGIEGRVAESRSLKFQKVENEINKIELGLGFDLLSPEFFGTSIFAGPSIVYGREVSRTLRYQFENQENMDMETLLEENYELQEFPINLRYDFGIKHSLSSKYSVQFILSTLKQLEKSGYDMPSETSYGIGLEIKL